MLKHSRLSSFATFVVSFLCVTLPALAAPVSFEAAKILTRQQVYQDQNQQGTGTFYCGCKWEWTGRSGGRVDLDSCGYSIRAQDTRAIRIEWEHIVPASLFGQQRQCWQQGGRSNCKRSDPVFNVMEADLHNLAPSIGETNADRSNYRFGMLPDAPYQHGACDFKVDFPQRVVQPRDEIKGQIARTYFYMHDRYDLRMSSQQQQLLMVWNRQFPPTRWEEERDRRLARLMGHHNEFVTGQRVWNEGHKNTADGVRVALNTRQKPTEAAPPIIGNSRSKVYHLPVGCPSYESVSDKNQVIFSSESQAISSGYRKAGNCR
ncbi:deoxyribonuclease I [Pseudomonas sp. gcc21]|uniref:endonuclease n=1 Tax=Pseudomonas sp. gcc21 TaxID=2726989 RepID=UPI0014525C3D|nr:endonuclease [Pseudomonas sp. gcc21]QJD57511.1 deoxyribonuclease I [Pseudomonas sp. gcc21]